jgi:hypothetical protein
LLSPRSGSGGEAEGNCFSAGEQTTSKPDFLNAVAQTGMRVASQVIAPIGPSWPFGSETGATSPALLLAGIVCGTVLFGLGFEGVRVSLPSRRASRRGKWRTPARRPAAQVFRRGFDVAAG